MICAAVILKPCAAARQRRACSRYGRAKHVGSWLLTSAPIDAVRLLFLVDERKHRQRLRRDREADAIGGGFEIQRLWRYTVRFVEGVHGVDCRSVKRFVFRIGDRPAFEPEIGGRRSIRIDVGLTLEPLKAPWVAANL